MNEVVNQLIGLIPEKFRPWALGGAIVLPYVTRGFHALANGGGLRGVWCAIWFGTNTPAGSSSSSSPAASRGAGPLLLLLAGGLALGAGAGCGTTPASKAAQVERVVITTVNDAMAEWKAHVDAGGATQAQIDNVRHAYKAYVLAQLSAKAVIEKSITAGDASSSQAEIDTANNSVGQAEQSLLALVNQYLGRL